MSARYAELQVTSNFTFLRGASHPVELVQTAAAHGHSAIALTDRNTLAGIVRSHLAAKAASIRFVVGCRLDFTDAPSMLAYPEDRAAYGRLSRLLTVGNRRAPKGECHLHAADLRDHAEGMVLVALPPDRPDATFEGFLADARHRFGRRLYLAAHHLCRGDDAAGLRRLADLAVRCRVPLVATNDVHYHHPGRRQLQDVLTCIREHCTIHLLGRRRLANAERHLKAAEEMARLFRRYPHAIDATAEIVDRCRFSLDELRYEYPDEVAGEGVTAQQELERLTEAGAVGRFPTGTPPKVRATIDHELRLIDQLGFAPYFLTVHDIVRFARSRGILCQGRGSAANSVVCYCLGITAVDPTRIDLLFERFISAARGEPPDIDVDFEHERREEVIQYIYAKYGRDRAGLAAAQIRFRKRAALRDVGKVMGLSADLIERLIGAASGITTEDLTLEWLASQGFDPIEPTLAKTLELVHELVGFPRHLSQHPGGFVITRGPLSEVAPILNAAMAERTTIEWDKDDLDALGILKIDILALGMLSAVRRCLDLLAEHHGRHYELADIPAEDQAVYAMLSRGDSVGVFQVESRAQMAMLPRLKPKTFYDLVIQVAIVRPGPIQGDMVHPYIRRRAGREPVEFPSDEVRDVLGKTLGVPLFQEQAMRLAVVAAGFTAEEADQLRRAMAAYRHPGAVTTFRDKMLAGMAARGYDREFAERCFKQIEGFGTYGFPESHAASFALLVYVSAWLKCHSPAAFTCALLNSQPMGFYGPSQLVRDAREHGVEVRAVDVNHSDWNCTLEPTGRGRALRLGLRQIKGLPKDDAERLVAARGTLPYQSPRDVRARSSLAVPVLGLLAEADAWSSVGLDRRQALWQVKALGEAPLPLFAGLETAPSVEPAVVLPALTRGEAVAEDYRTLSLSLKCHPLALLRDHLDRERPPILQAARLAGVSEGRTVGVAGLVLVRQRPGTAKGVMFITLEDETGVVNLVVWPDVAEQLRRPLLSASLLAVTGKVQREDGVTHVIVRTAADLTGWLRTLIDVDGGIPRSRDFR
ncbi:MAG: error-prone DNA polymerase [Rhodospirillaceae bacterium]